MIAADGSRERWLVAGKSAYATTHALPLAHAYRRRYGDAMAMWNDSASATPLPQDLVRFVRGWQTLSTGARVLCLDIPTLVRFRLLGRRCVFLYHALVGKGVLYRAGRPHAALRLAEDLLFPDAEQFACFPESWHARCRACGHLPEDWLALPETLLPAHAGRALTRWRAMPQPRVLLLATRGPLSAWERFREILADPPRGLSIGVKRHPALPLITLPDTAIDLTGVPVPLLAQAADLVVGDHSSATLEALRLGRPVALVETDALRAVEASAAASGELAYRDRVARLTSRAALPALLADSSGWPAARAPLVHGPPVAERVLDVLANID